MLGRKLICLRCINCSYNNIAKGIRLLDKIAIFVHRGFLIQVRDFESSIPLKRWEFRNKTRQLIKQAKRKYLFESVNNCKGTKAIWKHLRTVTSGSKSSIPNLPYEMSQCMRFPTMWYVRPAKPQISLRIRAV